MKAFLYIRVACADQLAAASQREALERYAKDKGYEVAAAVAADGISGVHTEGIMNFLLNEAKRQGIGTILARDTSRISRDTSSFMRFERKFRENGIRFEYLLSLIHISHKGKYLFPRYIRLFAVLLNRGNNKLMYLV